MLSVVIPSRDPRYLQKTVDDLLSKARGDVEVIVVFDGYWHVLKDDPRVTIIHQGTVHNTPGMREAINKGMAYAHGEYVMKIDEHCMLDEGYDLKLIADCEDNWIVIPRRYRLDPDKWEIIEDGRPPIDYMYLNYPYERPNDKSCGLKGKEWKRPEREHILIDDTMSMQGSCYFMKKSHWEKVIVEMDTKNYGQFTQEAQEICNKTWFSGGRVVVNKKTWYAHLHKGTKYGKGYNFSNKQYEEHALGMEKGRQYCIQHWVFDHDFQWLLDKFAPVPGWSANWKEQILTDKAKEI